MHLITCLISTHYVFFLVRSQWMRIEQWWLLAPVFKQASSTALCLCLSHGTGTTERRSYMYCARSFPPIYKVRIRIYTELQHSFCPRDSGPVVLHYANRQILTYALKVIKLSTFEYFFPKNSPNADEKVWGQGCHMSNQDMFKGQRLIFNPYPNQMFV